MSEDASPEPTDPDEPARSRRRVALLTAGVVAALVVVALATWLALRGADPSGPTGGAGGGAGEGAAPEQPVEDPTPTAPAPTSGTTAPDASAPPTTSAAPEPTPTSAATTLPADLALPAEGQEGWTATGWSYQPCGTPLSAAGVGDFRRITADGPDGSGHQALLVFTTPDEASAFLAAMRAAAEACAGPGDAGADVPAVVVGTLEGDWDDSLTVVQSYPAIEGGYDTGGDYTLAVRTGTAVTVSGGYAEWPPGYPTPDPGAVAEYRAALDALAPRLCVFTDAGC